MSPQAMDSPATSTEEEIADADGKENKRFELWCTT